MVMVMVMVMVVVVMMMMMVLMLAISLIILADILGCWLPYFPGRTWPTLFQRSKESPQRNLPRAPSSVHKLELAPDAASSASHREGQIKIATLTGDNSGHPVALPLVDVLRLLEAEGRVTRDDPTLLGRVGELPRMLDDTYPMLL